MAGSRQGQTQRWRRQGAWLGLLAVLVVGAWPMRSLAAGGGAASLGPPAVAVRQEITRLTETQLASLRRGIRVMQSRPETDPTSWSYQAHIHGFPAPGEDSACAAPTSVPQPAWGSCQHGSFFFLAWHRMYLYYFERILRQAAGDPTLTLPYWDYSPAASRELPLPFRQPADASNPLFVPERDPAANAGALRLQDSEVDAQDALGRPRFFVQPDQSGQNGDESFGGGAIALPDHAGSFAGQLELQPHNVIHNVIGGFMSDPNCAARDPLFYLHHANIDRLWEAWLRQGGHVNPTNDVWLKTRFTFFDEHSQPVGLTAQDILDTATQLGYRYDDAGSTPPASQAVAAARAVSDEAPTASEALDAIERLAVLGDTGQGAVDLGPQGGVMQVRLSEDGVALLSAPVTGASPPRLSLVLADVQLVQPGAYFAVYLNLPLGAEPDAKSLYYVGNIALFGSAQHAQHAQHGMPGREFMFDVTATVRALQEQGAWRDDFTLTFFRNNRSATAPGPHEPPVFLRVGRVLLMQF